MNGDLERSTGSAAGSGAPGAQTPSNHLLHARPCL